MRFGNLLSPPMPPLDRAMKIAIQSDELGFHSLVIPDHTLMVPPGLTPNALALLSAIAMKTQNIVLGTGVTDFVRYHPSILAQFFATLDHLAPGRAFLGIGAGEAMNILPFGIKWDKFNMLKEGIEIVKKLWTEEQVSFSGKAFKLENAFLQIKPMQKIPIYLGANGKRTRELTGMLCDGWMPIVETPKTYKENLEDVKRGAEKAGRKIEEIDTALQIYTAIDYDSAQAMERARRFAGIVISALEKVEQAGYSLDVPKDFSKRFYFERLLLTDDSLSKFIEYASKVSDDILADFFIVGNPEECISKIEEFRKAGVRHLMIINVGPDPKLVMKIYAEKIIPSFKED
ncbi:MAG: LLM class flavin-dependent oxidoreductase [Archaeoglobaceae archaeon]|nr:LLM class flavin-dependent oxidoreductase [Archaeoglobaceae archaeon]MDW8118529.1 LLM class flavin-dependent oxidoreductase [Archaeoglobaceae archaeon]